MRLSGKGIFFNLSSRTLSMFFGFRVVIASFSFKLNDNFTDNLLFKIDSRAILAFYTLKSLMQTQTSAKVLMLIKKSKFR